MSLSKLRKGNLCHRSDTGISIRTFPLGKLGGDLQSNGVESKVWKGRGGVDRGQEAPHTGVRQFCVLQVSIFNLVFAEKVVKKNV